MNLASSDNEHKTGPISGLDLGKGHKTGTLCVEIDKISPSRRSDRAREHVIRRESDNSRKACAMCTLIVRGCAR